MMPKPPKDKCHACYRHKDVCGELFHYATESVAMNLCAACYWQASGDAPLMAKAPPERLDL